jgi:hypothetical protein
MTPEQRFDKIENLLHTITELQARHDEAILRHDAQLEKQNAGIQDLIRVSRTLVDTVQTQSGNIDKLTDTVNRFLSGLQKPNGSH